ncbi:MAG: (2Fe-2S)-binding protein [Actinobacteria bacterium]|jgi:carbon-monoxide dehydrogenase small subunit|nr:(2Fe-2S)-binding protein [Actinomycetota bacterium]MCZ6567732.1 (2Fe-2S)-binding protein [Actinomycetota bacterium]MCZ6630693.1 (2Fe-2S)-binding protein [Actinomycetota bacterium]MCZ6738093.1 (2Fe-2S)-binding protein [Actinomycetota bacterium]
MMVSFTLNGSPATGRVERPVSLLDFLRDELEVTGSKSACEQGECGSCSVILDGVVVCSCLVMAADVEGSSVTTVEGLESEETLNAVQRAMHETGAVQCGFCTPGIVVAATDLFSHNPSPTTVEIKEALAGNICRCTGYGAIIRAFETLAEESA